MITNRIFGWVPDIPDHRDFMRLVKPVTLPPSVDLRDKSPQISDQGHLGSCVLNAIGSDVEFLQMKQNQPAWHPSRLFLYYNVRVLEGTVNQDAGCSIRDGFKVLNVQGVCPEVLWPYIEFQFARRPSPVCYKKALETRAVRYERLVSTNLDQLKGCLVSGIPFVFGVSVYESFMSDAVAKTGVVPTPSKRETLLGGHAMLAVGYEDKPGHIIVQNSWGKSWGEGGFCYLDYDYLTNLNLADDFWTLEKIT